MSQTISHQASRAGGFLQSIGVNAHLNATTSSYGSVSAVQNQLAYLGVNHVRDRSPATSNTAAYQTLGAAGIRFDLIVMGNLGQSMQMVDAVAPYVASVEGPNEVNVTLVNYQGLKGAAAAVAFQKDLYTAVHSDALLNNATRSTPVLNFTVALGGSYAPYGDLSAYADYTNVHAYGQDGVPPDWFLQPEIKNVTDTPGRPAIVTEAGNYTMPDHTSGVSQEVQAKWMLDTLFDNYSNGIASTYLYQLEDGVADPTNTNAEDHYGLFGADGTAKLAATAIHNLTTILADNGAEAASFTPSTLNYSVSGLPANANQQLIQKSDGSFDLVLWAEPQIWNTNTDSTNPITPANVTITFDGNRQSISTYDPLVGTAAMATYTNARAVQVSLTDHPIIISIGAASPAAVSAAAAVAAAKISSGPVILRTRGQQITGGAAALSVTDSAGGNTITGGAGVLSVSAPAGSDVISTANRTGTSSVVLGSGADTVVAGGATSIVANRAALTVSGDGPVSINGGTGNIVLTGGAGNEYVFTQASTANRLTLGTGRNTVLSHGADTITATGGTDSVYAAGAASIIGGGGALSVNGSGGAVTVRGGLGAVRGSVGSNGYLQGGSHGGNVLSTAGGHVTLAGGGAGDTLTDTGSGDNLLLAGPGNTTLTAGAGNDTLAGGSGADLFVLTRAAAAHSVTIQGYKAGTDHLRFSGFGSAAPIRSQAVIGGNLHLVLADNAQVILLGVSGLGSGFTA